LTRALVAIGGDNALALRLPGLFGVWLAGVALFRIVSRFTSPVWGAAAVAFLLRTLAYDYTVEARPYGWVLGCSAVALLCWQEYAEIGASDDPAQKRPVRWPWALGLFFSLGLVVTCHYYGFLIAIPLGVAEGVRTWENRRVDWLVWSALVLAVLPLPLHIGLVRHTLVHYTIGQGYSQDESTLGDLYNDLLGRPGMQACLFLAVLAALVSWLAAAPKPEENSTPVPRLSQAALWIFVLALPIAGRTLAVTVTGAIVHRYVLATTLGMAVAFAVLGYRLCRRFALAGAILVGVLGWGFLLQSQSNMRGARRFRPGQRKFPDIAFASRDGLPLVMNEPLPFLDWENAAPRVPPRVFLARAELGESRDPPPLEPILLTGAPFFGWHVQTWKEFTAAQRAFLVVSKLPTASSGRWSSNPVKGWTIQKALEERGNIQMLKLEGDYTLYLVQLPPVAK
jgi:hypothetical protein